MDAMKSDCNEAVSNAVEFWSSIAEVELDLDQDLVSFLDVNVKMVNVSDCAVLLLKIRNDIMQGSDFRVEFLKNFTIL